MRDSVLPARWILTLAFLATAAFLLARLAGVLVAQRVWTPEASTAAVFEAHRTARVADRLSDYRIILERNLFNAHPATPEPTPSPPKPDRPAETAAAPPLSSLDVTLVATAVVEGGRSFALVQEGSEVRLVREGEEVVEGARLAKVLPDRIRVVRGGRTEEILLFRPGEEKKPAGRPSRRPAVRPARSEPAGGAGTDTIRKVAEDRWVIDAREIEQAQENMSRLLTQIRVVPNFTDGQPDGFKVFAIRPGSLFARIGLQNGDVIKRINGIEIQGPEEAFEAYQRLKDETVIQIDLVRRNQNKTFTYEIR